MRKVFVVLVVVILVFSIGVSANEVVGDSEKDTLTAIFVNPIFEKASTIIKLSELSNASGLSFSYNQETGLLYADDGANRTFLKELDENIEVNANEIIIGNHNGEQIDFPYSFKVFTYTCKRSEEDYSYQSMLSPQEYYSEEDNVSGLAEAALGFEDGRAKIVLQKLETSSQTIDSSNIKEYLKNSLLLVNKSNVLGRDYTPAGLIYSKPARGRSSVNLRLDKEALLHLNSMLTSAYDEGISGMVITSAFRTFDKQTSLFNNKTTLLSRRMNRKTAMEEASKIVAIPGSSEHQTGLALDICSEGVGLIRNFSSTKQGKWLEENSWRFGFVVRYPETKTKITGIIYEPWHVRYVGMGHAEIMKTKNMCFEEYIEYLKANEVIYFSGNSGDNYIIQYINKEDFNLKGKILNLEEDYNWSISNCTKDSYILTIKL